MKFSADKESIGAAIGRIPSGCGILTSAHDGTQTGVLVSWFQQLGFEPPTICVALKQGRPIAPLIVASNRFVLCVLGENPAAMFKHFGKGFAIDDDAFAGLALTDTPWGPAIQDCNAILACSLQEKFEVGDHELLIGRVEQGAGDPSQASYVHLRKSGLGY